MKSIKIKLLKIRENGTAMGRFWNGSFNRSFTITTNLLGETIIRLKDITLGNNNEYIINHEPKEGQWEEYTYYPEDNATEENIVENKTNDGQISLF